MFKDAVARRENFRNRFVNTENYKKLRFMDSLASREALTFQPFSKFIFDDIAPKASDYSREKMTEVLNKLRSEVEPPSGTYYTDFKNRPVVVINRDDYKLLPKMGRRNVIAHEFFHANNPILGRSEILAHIYGGIKSKDKIFGNFGPVNMLRHLAKGRPGRFATELGVLGSLGLGTYLGIKAIKDKIDAS